MVTGGLVGDGVGVVGACVGRAEGMGVGGGTAMTLAFEGLRPKVPPVLMQLMRYTSKLPGQLFMY
jgi:hypothetical protein